MRSQMMYLMILLVILFESTLSQIVNEEDTITTTAIVDKPSISAFAALLRPFYFHPLTPTKRREKLSGLPPLPEDKYETEVPTTRRPFRLIPLQRITLPSLPSLDSYGINTIPELPPQHESKYAGQFAPDGSFIGKQEIRTAYLNPRHSLREEVLKWAENSELDNPQSHSIRTRDTKPDEEEDDADYEDDSFYRDPEIEKKIAKFLERHPIKDQSSPIRSKHPKEVNMTAITTIPENASNSKPIQKNTTAKQETKGIQGMVERSPPVNHSNTIGNEAKFVGERDAPFIEIQANNKMVKTTNSSKITIAASNNAKQIRRSPNIADSRISIRRLSSRNHEQRVASHSKNSERRQLPSGNNDSRQLSKEIHKPRRVHPQLSEDKTTGMSRVQLRKLHRLQALLEYIQQAPIAKTPVAIHANAGPTFQVQQQKQQRGFPGNSYGFAPHGNEPQFVQPIREQQLRPIQTVEELSMPQQLVLPPQLQPQPQAFAYQQQFQASRDPYDAAYLKEIEDYDLTLEFQKQQQAQQKASLNRRINVDYEDLRTPQGQKYVGPGTRNFIAPQLQVPIPTTTLAPLTTQAFIPIQTINNNNGNGFYYFNPDPLGLFGGMFAHPFAAGVRQTAANKPLDLPSSPEIVHVMPTLLLSNEQ